MSLLPGTSYNCAAYDVFQDICRSVACFSLRDFSRDGRRTPWNSAERRRLYVLPRKQVDWQVRALSYAIPLRGVPRDLDSK